MNQKQVLLLSVTSLVLLFILNTLFHPRFSAYAACRDAAMNRKGYGVWTYESTIQDGSQTYIIFSDGVNNFDCAATRIGLFWIVKFSMETQVGCNTRLVKAGEPTESCPEDYFGVEP